MNVINYEKGDDNDSDTVEQQAAEDDDEEEEIAYWVTPKVQKISLPKLTFTQDLFNYN